MKCSHCHQDRNEKSFHLDHNNQLVDTLYKTCNVCRSSARLRPRHRPERSKAGKKYRANNRVKVLANSYKHSGLCIKFGYDAEQLAKYNIEHTDLQSNYCAICGTRAKYLVLDHDHNTGKLRKMICRSCNLGIGNLNDSADICYKAAEYLRGFEEIN